METNYKPQQLISSPQYDNLSNKRQQYKKELDKLRSDDPHNLDPDNLEEQKRLHFNIREITNEIKILLKKNTSMYKGYDARPPRTSLRIQGNQYPTFSDYGKPGPDDRELIWKERGGRKNKKSVRKHSGIVQTGGNKGKLKKGYKYTGRRTKTGLPIIRKTRKR